MIEVCNQQKRPKIVHNEVCVGGGSKRNKIEVVSLLLLGTVNLVRLTEFEV